MSHGVVSRRRRLAELETTLTRYRSDVSLITDALAAMMAGRADGIPVPVDELPICQGIASLVTDVIAGMDLHAVDARTGTRVRATPNVLERPNPDEDRGETLAKLVQSMFWTGEAFAVNGPRDPRTGAVDAITVTDPSRTTWTASAADPLRVAWFTVYGERRTRPEVTMWKLNDDPRRGPGGESPLARCRTALATYGYAYRYLSDYFVQGGDPSSILRSTLPIGDAQAEEIQSRWIAARQEKRPAVMPSWIEFDIPSAPSQIEQTVRVLDFAAAEVARACNVPVTLANAPVAGGTSLTYANVADEFRRWVTVSLGTTWVARIERGFSSLLPETLRARLDWSRWMAELPELVTPAVERVR